MDGWSGRTLFDVFDGGSVSSAEMKKLTPLLYYPVQRGYAQGDSQEYSKGFDKRLKIDKTQNSR
jgi:hypothetical protein